LLFTQSPSPARSLVRDGRTSPHRPRLVVSRSICASDAAKVCVLLLQDLLQSQSVVRGPRPTDYCCGELGVVPAPEAEVALCRVPVEFIPPGSVVPGLSSGARGDHPFSWGGVLAGPASHAHPVASKRPPVSTPGHYADAHPDLFMRSLPVLSDWLGVFVGRSAMSTTEPAEDPSVSRPHTHRDPSRLSPPHPPMYMHVSLPTPLPPAPACSAGIFACGWRGILWEGRRVGGAVVGARSPAATLVLSAQNGEGLGVGCTTEIRSGRA
jgi:hypothetical protein